MCKECNEVKHICNGDKMFYNSFDELTDDLKEKYCGLTSGRNYTRAKQGYVKFINKLNEQGHTLISNYINTKTIVLIDFNCGHKPQNKTQNDYMDGHNCPECAEEDRSKRVRKAKTNKENIVANKYPELVKCFVNENDAYIYSYGSSQKVWLKCPFCGKHKDKKITIHGFVTDMITGGFGFPCDNSNCVNNKKHKLSIANKGENNSMYGIRGELHPSYKHDKTDEERERKRNVVGYDRWKQQVKENANFTCDCCGYVGEKNDGIMRSHHLNDFHSNEELRTDINNGVCLCKWCHDLFHHEYMGGNSVECTANDYYKWKQMKQEELNSENTDSNAEEIA